MRVYISSTPEELESHQAAACDVAHGLGFEPVLRDPAAGRGLDPVRACARQVATADLVLAIVGWRRGRVPPPELGGDGFHPWTWWETRSGFDHGKPVVVLMAGESWPPELREQQPGSRAVMQDFRGELGRLASFLDDEPTGGSPPLPGSGTPCARRGASARRVPRGCRTSFRAPSASTPGCWRRGRGLKQPRALTRRRVPGDLNPTRPAGGSRRADLGRSRSYARSPFSAWIASPATNRERRNAATRPPKVLW